MSEQLTLDIPRPSEAVVPSCFRCGAQGPRIEVDGLAVRVKTMPAARCGDLTSPGKVGVSDERRDAGAAARTVSSWSDPRVDNVRLTARYREDGRAAATNQPGDTP